MNLSNNADKSDMLYVKDFSEAGVQTIQANLKDGLKPEDLKGMRFATTGGDDYKRNPNEKFKVVLYKNQGVNDVTYKVSNEAFNVKTKNLILKQLKPTKNSMAVRMVQAPISREMTILLLSSLVNPLLVKR